MELPIIQLGSSLSMASRKSSRQVRVDVREPTNLPKLTNTKIKVKVSPHIIDDDALPEGFDFSTDEVIRPVAAGALQAAKANYLSTMRRKSSNIMSVNRRMSARSREVLMSSYLQLTITPGDAGDGDSSSGDSDLSTFGDVVEVRKERGIKRFRAVARMVKNNLFWSRDLRNKMVAEEEEDTTHTFTVTNQSARGHETLSFNVNNFKTRSKTYGGLTPISRKILLLPPHERTDEDINILKEVIERLKCFQKYSKKVKQELARVIHLDSFEDGRKIIQQGYKGLSFYFIVTGGVIIKHSELDARTGQKHSQVIGQLEEGSSFGELALIHDIERQASYYCKGNSEFLRIDKDDFNEVLRMNYEYEYQRRHQALKSINVFRHVDSSLLISVSDQCSMTEVLPNTILVGDTHHTPECVTFIQSGEVKVVREIIVWKETLQYGRIRYVLKDLKQFQSVVGRRGRATLFKYREERHLLTLFCLKHGDYFNTGENLENTYIIAVDKVELMHVPRILFGRFGLNDKLENMRILFDATLPTDQETFDMYMDNKRWKNYKRKVTMNVVNKRDIKHKTRMTDVPLTIRMKDCINLDR